MPIKKPYKNNSIAIPDLNRATNSIFDYSTKKDY